MVGAGAPFAVAWKCHVNGEVASDADGLTSRHDLLHPLFVRVGSSVAAHRGLWTVTVTWWLSTNGLGDMGVTPLL